MVNISFDGLVAVMRREFPGQVTVVSYAGLKWMLDHNMSDVWDFAETLTLAAVVRDCGTTAHKLRLAQEIQASRWSTEIMTRAEE